MKGNLLLIDDEPELSQSMKELFEEEAGEIFIANNGEEALKLLEENDIHCVVSDIKMPVMDGLTFLKHARIKSQAKVIILSSVSLTGSAKAAEARRLGADAIMTKPSGAVSMNLEEASGSQIIRTIHQVLRQ